MLSYQFQTKHVSFSHRCTAHQLGRKLTQFLLYVCLVFPLELSCGCRRIYHSLCCSCHTAHSPLFQCMYPWADMDAPFSFTEVSISRRAKGNRALHMNTWGKRDTLTNSVLLHQCKIQTKMSNRCLLDWEQKVYSYIEITCSGVRHHQSSSAKTLNIHIIVGDEKFGKLTVTVNWAATNMVTKTHATQSVWVGTTAWKMLKTPCLPQPAFSPCVEGAALLIDLQRWIVMLSLFSKEILAPGRQRCLALYHPRLPRTCEAVERHCPSALLKRGSHGEFLVPCLTAAAPSRAEVPINALKPTLAASLVPLLRSSWIGSLPSARVLFQSDRGFPWGEWGRGRGGKEGGKKATIPSQKVSRWSSALLFESDHIQKHISPQNCQLEPNSLPWLHSEIFILIPNYSSQHFCCHQ